MKRGASCIVPWIAAGLIAAPVGGAQTAETKQALATPTPRLPAVIEGVVKGPDGKPVEGARVIAQSATARRGESPVLARTDTNGRFKLTLERGSTFVLRVEAGGLAFYKNESVRPGISLAISLQRGSSIEGTVLDAGSGQPVARARIRARAIDAVGMESEPEVGRIEATSDGKGRFRLAGVAPGLYVVTASLSGVGAAIRSSVAAGSRIELRLVSGASIAGTVRDPLGEPIGGAVVKANAGEHGLGGPVLEKTDRRGQYEIVGLQSGPYRVTASHRDWAPSKVARVDLSGSSQERVDLELRRGVTVVGRMVGADDRPVSGTVTVQELDGETLSDSTVATLGAEAGADGVFRIAGIPAGSHALAARPKRHAPKRVEIEVSPKAAQVNIGDVRVEAGLAISGRVRAATGEPIGDAEIRPWRMSGGAMLPEARSEPDGTFELVGLESGTYRLMASAAGYGSADLSVEAGADKVDLVLKPAGGVAGTVVDDSGRPVESFTVSVSPAGGRRRMWFGRGGQKSFGSPDGRFRLDDLDEGDYVVTVTAPERAGTTRPDVKIAAASTTDIGRVVLGAGGVVRGTVMDTRGNAVAGAAISIEGLGFAFGSWDSSADVATDTGGAFEIRGVAAGSARVVARHADFAQSSATVEVDPAKGPAEARIVMSQGGRIVGSARRRDGSAIPGAMVHAEPTSTGVFTGRMGGTPVSADGTFVVEHVSPGRNRVTLMNTSRRFPSIGQMREVDVREGETVTVDFSSRDILVSGHVIRAGGTAAGLRLRATSQAGSFYSDAAGSLDAPPTGPQRMTATVHEDGGYEMLVDQPGTIGILAETVDGRLRLPMKRAEIPDVDAFTLNLNYAGVAVSGVVVDKQTNEPVAHAFVQAWSKAGGRGSQARSGADGRFQLELEPGDYTVKAQAEDYAPEQTDLTVGDTGVADLRLALSPGLAISGKVVDPTGRGVGGLAIGAMSTDATASWGSDFSLPDGSFRLRGLAPGTFNISAHTATGFFAMRPRVPAGTKDVVLQLAPGGSVTVRIVGPDGRPASNVWVQVVTVNGEKFADLGTDEARTDSAGLTAFSAPAGNLDIAASSEAGGGRATAAVQPGGDARVEIRLTPRDGKD